MVSSNFTHKESKFWHWIIKKITLCEAAIITQQYPLSYKGYVMPIKALKQILYHERYSCMYAANS